MKKLIIFDFDGTICDTLDLFYNCFTSSCQELGIRKYNSIDNFLALFENNLYESLSIDGIDDRTITGIQTLLGEKLKDQLNYCYPFPGLKSALMKLLKEGNLLYIITSSISSVIKDYLQMNKFNIFSGVMGADKGNSKVEKILHVKKMNPEYQPYYVGDTPGDIIEGEKAGCHTVGVSWGWFGEKLQDSVEANIISLKPENLYNDILAYENSLYL